jgi:hypothetical protein
MSVYTVQTPTDSLGEPALAKAVFLREGFSWPAFFFGLLFVLWHRLWAVAALWLAGLILLAWLATSHLSFANVLLIDLALRILLGLEGNALRRRKLTRRRYQLAGIVSAATLESAERLFFARVTQAPTERASASHDVQPPPMPHQTTGVLGVFPEPETGR